MRAQVFGAGLAGCEAAYQLASRGVSVTLYEMKPEKMSPAHKSADFAELVCSNSLRAGELSSAVGLLKEEMRRMGSLIMKCADETRVPAGGALAVDREGFSGAVTAAVKSHPNIQVVNREVREIPETEPVIVATGPLSSETMGMEISRLLGKEGLYFYDAAAPIVTKESINMEKAFFANRYGKGEGVGDYINCPMTRVEYEAFYEALIAAEEAETHSFESLKVFEGCMPVEVMARRGEKTLLFGPLKPVGLRDPRTPDQKFHAVVQLRPDNREGTIYNIVGFQTHLRFPEQKRVFSMIPGLENAEFVRYGVMHRNTFINAPEFLNQAFRLKTHEALYFAGQMTGVEGYVESAASGLLAGLSLYRRLNGQEELFFPRETALGALSAYISEESAAEFQPMNINFGIFAPLEERIRGKQNRKQAHADRALRVLEEFMGRNGLS